MGGADPSAIIAAFGMAPHPEGGHFEETFRDQETKNGRALSTAICFLLKQGERSHWHRVDATELWHFYAGDPLLLRIAKKDRITETIRMSADFVSGDRPQAIVPAGAWQSAQSLGAWTLVGCTVAPGFEFAKFEIAPKDWTPGSWTSSCRTACPSRR